MSYRASKKSDSVSMRALQILFDRRYEFVDQTSTEMIWRVLGEHSEGTMKKVTEVAKPEPYTVIVRKNGECMCTCENYLAQKKGKYKFFSDKEVRGSPECSHILAIKYLPQYMTWVIDPKDLIALRKATHPSRIDSFVEYTGHSQVSDDHGVETPISIFPQPRKVKFHDLIRDHEQDILPPKED